MREIFEINGQNYDIDSRTPISYQLGDTMWDEIKITLKTSPFIGSTQQPKMVYIKNFLGGDSDVCEIFVQSIAVEDEMVSIIPSYARLTKHQHTITDKLNSEAWEILKKLSTNELADWDEEDTPLHIELLKTLIVDARTLLSKSQLH